MNQTPELRETDEGPETPEIGDTPELLGNPRSSHRLAMADAVSIGAFSGKTGDDVIALARQHLGQRYVLGARAPMANAAWAGPWDCAEFVSWCVFQTSGILYGTQPRNDPILADAFTGFWADQAENGGHLIAVEEAAAIPGAAVLRKPRSGQIGHIVLSDGKGGTLEAHSAALGVIAGSLSQRRWDCGILVPGIRFFRSDQAVQIQTAGDVIRLTTPLMRGDRVRQIQQRLIQLGFAPGAVDGVYGPQTAHAVRRFQALEKMLADGEVGPATLAAFKLPLVPAQT
jgi:hypothetical protein